MKLIVNPFECPTTAYPESERVLRVLLDHYHAVSNEVYVKVDLDTDGNMSDGLNDDLSYAIHRRFGAGAEYLGYEDVTNIEDGEE